jgi:hypothetical protein
MLVQPLSNLCSHRLLDSRSIELFEDISLGLLLPIGVSSYPISNRLPPLWIGLFSRRRTMPHHFIPVMLRILRCFQLETLNAWNRTSFRRCHSWPSLANNRARLTALIRNLDNIIITDSLPTGTSLRFWKHKSISEIIGFVKQFVKFFYFF